jgi:hypothetical protein
MRIFGMLGLAVLITGTAQSGLAASAVKDGSFEHGKFIDGGSGYMELPNGSTTILGWTVTTSSGNIVWAKKSNVDHISPSSGKYCIDLTGFGSDAVNGAVSQSIHVKPGITYSFSVDSGSFDDATPVVTIGGQAVALTRGTPITVNGTSWTPLTGTFTVTKGNRNPTLTIENTTPGAQLVFIDNVRITAQ